MGPSLSCRSPRRLSRPDVTPWSESLYNRRGYRGADHRAPSVAPDLSPNCSGPGDRPEYGGTASQTRRGELTGPSSHRQDPTTATTTMRRGIFCILTSRGWGASSVRGIGQRGIASRTRQARVWSVSVWPSTTIRKWPSAAFTLTRQVGVLA